MHIPPLPPCLLAPLPDSGSLFFSLPPPPHTHTHTLHTISSWMSVSPLSEEAGEEEDSAAQTDTCVYVCQAEGKGDSGGRRG